MSYRDRRGPRDYDDRRDDRYSGGGRPRYEDRGGRGGRGGGRGGGCGRGGGPPQHRPTECMVVVNYNKLRIKYPEKHVDLYVYKVSIKDARWEILTDDAGEKVTDPMTGRFQRVFRTREMNDKGKKGFFKSMKPMRIFKELVKEQHKANSSFHLDYDGAEMAIAPSGCGPSEDETRYEVCIKQDCDMDHPDADKMRKLWFEVVLVKTHSISSSDLAAAINGQSSRETLSDLSTALNVIMKSVGTKNGMLSFGSQLPSLFFPMGDQIEIFKHRMTENRNNTKFLLSGIKQSAVFSAEGCNIQLDPVVTWFDKEKYDIRTDGDRNKVKIIEYGRNGVTIAGVRVNLDRLANDPRAQSEVEAALTKLMLNFEYVIQKTNAKKEEEMLARGRTSKDVQESRRRVFLEKSLYSDRDQSNLKIKWSPNDHSFQVGEAENMTTVTQYYFEKYGIKLDEKLPIVYTGKTGWLPLEFAYQGFTKTKDANTKDKDGDDLPGAVLKYYDTIAGTNLRWDMEKKTARLSGYTKDGLEKYNLKIEEEPTTLRAKVLQQPQIKFLDDKGQDKISSPRNGSWDLRDVKFKEAAELDSFAVLNCGGSYNIRQSDITEYVSRQLRINIKHGMQISQQAEFVGERELSQVMVEYEKFEAEDRAPEVIGDAIKKARDVFLYDSLRMYQRDKCWHKTSCYPDMNKPVPVQGFILPPGSRHNQGNEIGIMFDPSIDKKGSLQYCTHDIELNDGRPCDRTRLKVKVNRSNHYHDPFEVKDGRDITGYVFECHLLNGQVVHVDEEKVGKMIPLHKEKDVKINCPSIIFAILPDTGKALYDRIKTVSILSGAQTQCIVMEKYRGQRNKDQYASNIAAKVNAKLADSIGKAAAWNADNGTSGIQWVGECKTLVIGIGMVHGMGATSDTVVAANVCLDSQCMRLASTVCLQKKSDVVNKFTMKYIVTESWDKFVADNQGASIDNSPQRVDDEIAYIREAIKSKTGTSCACDSGCRKCCPPITFVICQSQNNTRVVPLNENEGYQGRSVNVHSGTAVDHNSIIELGTLLSIPEEDVSAIQALNDQSKTFFGPGPLSPSYDFLLTAQGGLKGTSKPIYYRVRLNENACWGPKGCTALTKENLMSCTYQMAYQYASATKAVRELPVIKYSKKLGNQVLSSLKCLREGVFLGGKEFVLENPPDTIEDDIDNRPYIRVAMGEGHGRMYNVVQPNFCKHLAA